MWRRKSDLQVLQLTVCGAGNGAHALVPIAAVNLGCRVNVYAPWGDEAERLASAAMVEGITAEGLGEPIAARPCRVSADPGEVIPGSQVVLILAPAFAHEPILRSMVSHLMPGAMVGAMPARGGFEHAALNILREHGREDVTIFGFQTLPWACRIRDFGRRVQILGIKNSVGLATIPAAAAPGVVSLFHRLLGVPVEPLANMLSLTLGNVGQIIHPGIMYGQFRDRSDARFSAEAIPLFYQGVTPAIADLLQAMSDEIQEVKRVIAERYPIDLSGVLGIREWLFDSYQGQIDDSSSLSAAFVTNRAYQGLKVPAQPAGDGLYRPDFQNRYLTEDVPHGLVVTRAIAAMAGVPTPTIDAVLTTTAAWMGKEYLVAGAVVGRDVKETRIPQNYGISDLDALVALNLGGWGKKSQGGQRGMKKGKEKPVEVKGRRRVLAASVGDCVHSLGVETFAEWLEDQGLGYMSVKLGPAVPIDEVINKIRESRPEVVAVSSRLGDLHVDKLIGEFVEKAHRYGIDPKTARIRYCFGGLRLAANLVRAMTGQPILPDKFSPVEDRHYDLEKIAEEYREKEQFQGFFELIADDYITMEELQRFAERKQLLEEEKVDWADDLLERIRQVRQRENRPIIRAHIGIAAETIEPTIEDIKKVCEAGALEIVSLGPDQPSQAYLAKFIRGEEDPDKYLRGQGGVPIRSKEDLIRLKEATRCGNYPTVRIYSGTDELLELAKVFEETLHMPFPAVPIFFYNKLDGRGPIAISEGFDEHFAVIRWWAEQGKPLEINDPHQWQLRNCSDDMYVTDHLICGVVALKMGIKHYIMQLMFDLPPQISARNDLAKMRAAYELIEPLTRHFDFNIIKETRGGLSSFPPNLDMAKGHLATTTHWQMYLEPDIIHVVSFPEAHHEAKAEDIIESCDIVKQVVRDFYKGEQPNVLADPGLISRKEELKRGAMYNLLHLALMGGYQGKVTVKNFHEYAVSPEEAAKRPDPAHREKNFETMILELIDEANYATGDCGMISADTLDLALQVGLLQAPKITVIDKRYEIVGKCRTKIVEGACRTDQFDGIPVKDEMERVALVRRRAPWYFDKSISQADDASHISEVAEEITPEVIEAFRKELGITDLEDKKILVVDFGSTFSKVGILDTATEEYDFRYVPTTVDDLREGLANALGVLDECREAGNWEPLRREMDKFDYKFPCSSAKGGLKVVTVSLVKEESGEAADLAALTAGAKLLNSYAGKLTESQARQIYEVDQPEIILLAGGVDEGGDTETQLHNARMLAKHAKEAKYARYGVPVIYAGNQDVADQVVVVFRAAGVDIRVTANVMPEVNQYNIEAVNEAIRDVFQTIIIRGKGFDVIEEFMSTKLIPTPRAAFLGINLLARGYGEETGIGNILALDIGGATTDFYAIVRQNPLYTYHGNDPKRKNKRTILKTPNAPLAYRRVEGKYGLSYDAENLTELARYQSGQMQEELNSFFNQKFPGYQPARARDNLRQFVTIDRRGKRCIDLGAYLKWISQNPHTVPVTPEETAVTAFLAREIMAIATRNNVGYVDETDTYFLQYGVNSYSEDCATLLIGGTIYHKCKDNQPHHLEDLKVIASGALYNPDEEKILRPRGQVLMDASYLVSIVGGLFGRIDPVRALRIIKKHLRPLPVAVDQPVVQESYRAG